VVWPINDFHRERQWTNSGNHTGLFRPPSSGGSAVARVWSALAAHRPVHEVAYVPSFCEHLKNKGIKFVRSNSINDEWGTDNQNKRWEITTNEIALSGLLGPDDILQGWEIPRQGP
jgi:hypothetical protein